MENAENNSIELTREGFVEDVTSEMKQFSLLANPNEDEDQVICGGGVEPGGPFKILPEELWMTILDKLVNPEDILNTLRAFPELDKPSENKRTLWLFGLVLPHLMTKHMVHQVNYQNEALTRSSELMKLRLVSKRWKYAVERALENHFDRRPILPRVITKSGSSLVTIPDSHFSYHRLRGKCPSMASKFDEEEDIDRFLEEMGNLQGNPFPSKSVILQPNILSNFRQSVARTVVLLERFGQHVLDFEINYINCCDAVDVGDLETCRNILRCLSNVPNLRSLIFTGKIFWAKNPERENFFVDPESQKLFPKLRNLERFEWRVRFDYGESTWITRMLETYGKKDGLRKLGIPINLFWTTDLTFCDSEIHLTELHLFLDSDIEGDVDTIEEVVKSVPNYEEVRKFWLSSLGGSGFHYLFRKVKINDLIGMLAEFQFESVVLQDVLLVEEEEDEPISEISRIPAATSITSLDLEEHWEYKGYFSYEFLRRLPSLKFLTIFINHVKMRRYWIMERDEKEDLERESIGKKLRRYFVKVYNPRVEIPEDGGIWKEIPSLEMLTVVIEVEGEQEIEHMGAKFVREFGNQGFFWRKVQCEKLKEDMMKEIK